VSVNNFINTIAKYGGMSYSNNFEVKFINPKVTFNDLDTIVSLFCNEAQLPNSNTAQGTVNGLYVGSGTVQYPHTRVYTELQLGFMLDANLSALKFLNKWLDFIFSGDGKLGTVQEWQDQQNNKSLSQLQSLATTSIRPENRAVRLKYRDEYACTMLISKTEQGPYAANQRAPITYVLENAYPYAIDAIPLSYGNSQITQVSAQFSYSRHYTIPNNITSVVGTLAGMYTGKAKSDVQQRVVPGSKT
jgi:hypothetical protein